MIFQFIHLLFNKTTFCENFPFRCKANVILNNICIIYNFSLKANKINRNITKNNDNPTKCVTETLNSVERVT